MRQEACSAELIHKRVITNQVTLAQRLLQQLIEEAKKKDVGKFVCLKMFCSQFAPKKPF